MCYINVRNLGMRELESQFACFVCSITPAQAQGCRV